MKRVPSELFMSGVSVPNSLSFSPPPVSNETQTNDVFSVLGYGVLIVSLAFAVSGAGAMILQVGWGF